MTREDVTALCSELSELLGDRLGVGGTTLARRLDRAGRLLPRFVRRAGRDLVDAQARMANPKLMKQIDAAALRKSHHICRSYLLGIDRERLRANRLADLWGSIGLNILFVLILLITVLVWRGFV